NKIIGVYTHRLTVEMLSANGSHPLDRCGQTWENKTGGYDLGPAWSNRRQERRPQAPPPPPLFLRPLLGLRRHLRRVPGVSNTPHLRRQLSDKVSPMRNSQYLEDDSWNSETDTLASKCFVDLFVRFFDAMRSQLENVVAIITSFLSSMLTQGWLLYSIWLLQCYLFFRTSSRSCKMLRFLIETTLILMVNYIQIMNLLTMMKGRANMETSSYAIVRMKSHIK
ncbi:unnamed protein product, partial [Musa acuminata var. zebrina]